MLFSVNFPSALSTWHSAIDAIASRQHPAVKYALAALLDFVPPSVTAVCLRRAAIAPPSLKGALFERLCGSIARRHLCGEKPFVTNLGIAASLRCCVPLRKSSYVFGRPNSNISERATIALVTELANDCSHFLDIGANEGIFSFSVLTRRPNEITVHWFEPDITLARRLTSNLQNNHLPAHGNTLAVSDVTGHCTYYRNLTDDASGSLTDLFTSKHLTEQQTIQTVRLDEYLINNDISNAMVKIDVEGAGLLVWRGAEKRSDKIRYLIMEMLEPEIACKVPSQIIDATGWHAWYIRDFDLVELRAGEFQYRESFYNWLFCDLDAAALAARLGGTEFTFVPAS